MNCKTCLYYGAAFGKQYCYMHDTLPTQCADHSEAVAQSLRDSAGDLASVGMLQSEAVQTIADAISAGHIVGFTFSREADSARIMEAVAKLQGE